MLRISLLLCPSPRFFSWAPHSHYMTSSGHLPGTSDSIRHRWSAQPSPEIRPSSRVHDLGIHLDSQARVPPAPPASHSSCPAVLGHTSHCIAILSGTDVSNHFLSALPAAILVHLHFITQLEWSFNNNHQIVPFLCLKHINNFSLLWE